MQSDLLLSVTPLYVAILGILFIVFTVRAGMYRVKTQISLGTGDDPEMLRRMRSQANFIETVPTALFVLVTIELLGMPALWLHGLCSLLVFGRVSHYLALNQLGPFFLRPVGMISTFLPILIGSIWIFVKLL